MISQVTIYKVANFADQAERALKRNKYTRAWCRTACSDLHQPLRTLCAARPIYQFPKRTAL